MLFGCTEFAVRALSEKVRSGCVHFERSRPLAGRAGCGAGPGVQTCAHGGKMQLYEQLNGEKKEKKARCLVLLIFGSFKGQAEIRDLTLATKST